MKKVVLVLNAGSSSIKFSLYELRKGEAVTEAMSFGEINGIGGIPRFTFSQQADENPQHQTLSARLDWRELLSIILKWVESHITGHELIAAGHRVVHGGADFTRPVIINDKILQQFNALIPLAPSHQPQNLAAIEVVQSFAPDLPQVACFDTAFHHGQSDLATTFALPKELRDDGIRRYGFHGLSYDYITTALPEYLDPVTTNGKIVIAHLGHGASMCAIKDRKSVATSMGFTALDGLPMGRRCGALDPGVLLYLMREKDMDHHALSELLYQQSGLLGLSGLSDDMRELLETSAPEAKFAIAYFTYWVSRGLGSLAASVGGIDALVFTGGIGEHAPTIRREVCERAGWLGIDIDEAANARGEIDIGRPGSHVKVLVIPTNENLVIARHTANVLAQTDTMIVN